jgi:Fe-S oxidoreductase
MAAPILWVLLLISGGAFIVQIWRRVRLVIAAPSTFSFDAPAVRTWRVLADVLGQRQTIRERPLAGLAHALVFWGFLAFGGYTAVEFLDGLGLARLADTRWFAAYRVALTPFACAVLAGIAYLILRRTIARPPGLGARVSVESVVIGAFIATLMITFLLTWWVPPGTLADRVNWWVHMGVILAFLPLIPASKHLHLILAPVTLFLRSAELGAVPNLRFEREEVGLERIGDLGSKTVLDSLTCVECGRCQDSCPAFAAGQALNPKTLILQTRAALLAGQRDAALVDVYSEEVLWQCTTCGACEKQCPVGIEHLPLVVGARRGLVSNGEAPAYLASLYTQLERRANVWGLGYDARERFVAAAELETFDATRHDVLVWLGCAGAFEADFQQSLRSLFAILRARGVRFGVLAKESCTGDVAKRTGNELLFQELAAANIKRLEEAGAGGTTILTSCPHCVKTLGADYGRLGWEGRVQHSAVFVEALTRDLSAEKTGTVTFHDPCYLGRYEGAVDEPRALLARFGGETVEPARHGSNPYCCGAGGGLMFADREEAKGSRIADVRLGQLRDTGASTVVTACPFCSVMLKGAQASASDAPVQFVDLMTFVAGRMERAGTRGAGAPNQET